MTKEESVVMRGLVGWLKNVHPCPECGEGKKDVIQTHPSYPMVHDDDCEIEQLMERARELTSG